MYKFYVIPDATKLTSHSEVYSAQNMKLFWDPRSESSSYAILEAKIKNELNKAGSLEFSLLPTNIHYNDFHKKKSVVLVYDDNDLMFEGVVSANPSDFYKQRRVTCIGTLAHLVDSIQAPDEKNETVVPESISGTMYIQVPLIWYEGLNPNSEQWYERQTNDSGEFVYTLSADTAANPSKVYYYASSSSGTNISGTTITRKAATKETIHDHIARLLEVHNAQVDPFKQVSVGQINSEDSDVHEFSSTGWRTTWESLNSDILEGYGKYFTVTTSRNGSLSLNYLNISQMSSATPVIEYARNMLEMTEAEENNDNIFTVLVPIGKNNLTVEKATGHTTGGNNEIDPYIATFGGQKRYVVVSKAAIARYGYIVKTQTFSDVSKADDLYDKAVQYIKNNYDYHKEYDVKAIDLKVIGESDHRIQVGDKCRVLSKWHGVDERDLYVISAEIDPINPENDTFKIGVPTQDREAGNRRITGQLNNNRNKTSSNASNYASGMSSVSSALENVIHVTEWGLEMNSNLRNIMETNDGKYKTQFEQTGEHVALTAEKLFGVVGEEDSKGFVLIPLSDRVGKEPKKEGWYEYGYDRTLKKNCYMLTEDTTPVSGKNYYTAGLWKRVSEIEVDEGGIHSRVQGNYKTATAIASWIEANEDAILAITGHIHVDKNGQVIIDSGAGARTGHTETRNETKYYKVPKSWYSKSPSGEGWYEQKTNGAGTWTGEGKAVLDGSDFVLSRDSSADPKKYYYYKNTTTEEFYAEYGIYNEGNLTGGVVARAINHPNYKEVSRHLITSSANPNQNGWYEYNPQTDSFGLSLATSPDFSKKYYTVENNFSDVETTIKGDRVIVGWNENYSGLDKPMRDKITQYVKDHNLDGTITEIASDVVVVNSLIAKYIEADEIIANTYLRSELLNATRIIAEDYVSAGNRMIAPDFWINSNPNRDPTKADSIKHGLLSITAGPNVDDANNSITATTSGDTVTISLWTMDSRKHSVSFDKPASLGTVTWSSGERLTVKTAGGKTFFEADLQIPKAYSSSEMTYAKDVNGNIAPTIFLRDRHILYGTMNVSGTWTGETHDPEDDDPIVWSDTIYIDATKAFDAGKTEGIADAKSKFRLHGPTIAVPSGQAEAETITNAQVLSPSTAYKVYNTYDNTLFGSTIYFKTPAGYSDGYNAAVRTFRTYSNWAVTDNGIVTLGYSGSASVYGQYKAEGASAYKNLAGVLVKSPSKGSFRTYASYNNTEYTSGSISLGSGDSVTVYGQRKMDGDNDYESAAGITITAPSSGSVSTYYERLNSDDEWEGTSLTTAASVTLDYSESVVVKGRYQDAFGNWTSGYNLTVTSKPDNYSTGKTDGIAEAKSKFSIHGPTVAVPSGQAEAETITNSQVLSYNTAYKIYNTYDGALFGSTIYFRSPSRGSFRTYASYNNTEYTNGSISLGYGNSVTIYGQRKMDGDNDYESAAGITITAQSAPGAGSVKTYYEYDSDGDGDAEGTTLTKAESLALKFGETLSVRGRYVDASNNATNAYVLTVTSPSKPTLDMRSKATYPATGDSAHTYYGDDNDNWQVYLAGSGYVDVFPEAKQGDDSYSSNRNYVRVWAPSLTMRSKATFPASGDNVHTYYGDDRENYEIYLSYDDTIDVYPEAKLGDDDYSSSNNYVRIHAPSAPGSGSVKTYYERLNSDDEWEGTTISANSSVTLGYSESVVVKGRYQDASGNWTSGYNLTVTAPSKSTISKSDIDVGNFGTSQTAPNVDYTFSKTSSARSAVASADGRYLTFRVKVGSTTKTYAIDCSD